MKSSVRIYITIALIAFAALALAITSLEASAQEGMQPITVTQIEGYMNITIMDNGVALVSETLKMSTAAYTMFKNMYNPLSTFIRQLNWGNTPQQLVDVKIEADDANNELRARYKALGAAIYIGDHRWKVPIGNNDARIKLVDRKGSTLILTATYMATKEYVLEETIRIKLPSHASNIVYDQEKQEIYYTLGLPGENGGGNIFKPLGAAITVAGAMLLIIPLARRRRSEPELPPPPPAMP